MPRSHLSLADARLSYLNKSIDSLTGNLVTASMEIRSDRVILTPSIYFGRHFPTNIKHGGTVLAGQVNFALIQPTRITILSSIAIAVTMVTDGTWDSDQNIFSTLEPGGRFAIAANTLTELKPSTAGLLIETLAALAATESIQIYVEGYEK